MLNKAILSRSLVLTCLLSITTVNATTGYFSLGYGPKSTSMAGATVAAPQDAMVGAINPAGFSWIDKQVNLSFRAFNPERSASLDTRVVGGNFKVEDDSDSHWFYIPGAAIALPLTKDLSFGLTIYGNGGMNTDYSTNIYDESAAVLGAFAQAGGGAAGVAAAATVPQGTGTGTLNTGRLGVDLAQAIIAPTLSYKIHQNHSIGLSALVAVQRFEARGLGNFQCFTPSASANNPAACASGRGASAPGFIRSNYLSDNGHDWSYGIGVRVGWISQIIPELTVGGAFSSKIYMTRFDKYKELFAENGSFDIPSQFQLGVSLRPIDSFQISFDYQRIFYSDVNSVGNPGPILGPSIPSGSGLLGTSNGIGFGWKDINVFRVGAAYNLNKQFTIRAGYSWNESPIPDNQLLFNILAPATITRHITAGISYNLDEENAIHLSYVHAFHESQNVSTSAFGVPASISMHQNSIEIGYSWK